MPTAGRQIWAPTGSVPIGCLFLFFLSILAFKNHKNISTTSELLGGIDSELVDSLDDDYNANNKA